MLNKLLWGLTTREGRDEFFGRSKANQALYRARFEMLNRFEAAYPEFSVWGSVDNYNSVLQWTDGIEQNCYCVKEGESRKEALEQIGSPAGMSSLRTWWVSELCTEIPMLLSNYRTYRDYVSTYKYGLNIVLADCWLNRRFYGDETVISSGHQSITELRDVIQEQCFLYLKGKGWPYSTFKEIAALEREPMLMLLSQVLWFSNFDSVISELPFQEVPVLRLSDDDFAAISGLEVPFWSRVLRHRFNMNFFAFDPAPTIFSEFR